MDWAKENMQNAFNGVYRINYQFSLNFGSLCLTSNIISSLYMPLQDIINERQDKQFHRPLHLVTYYLNPQLLSSPRFKLILKLKVDYMTIQKGWW